ncbi:MAG: hypothetical protein AAGC54_05585 [Cyanobacteria bacterium P01_F01_bin.4]
MKFGTKFVEKRRFVQGGGLAAMVSTAGLWKASTNSIANSQGEVKRYA